MADFAKELRRLRGLQERPSFYITLYNFCRPAVFDVSVILIQKEAFYEKAISNFVRIIGMSSDGM